MEGYFSIKVKFVMTVLLAVLLYVSYLYVFKEQRPTDFSLSKDCTPMQIEEESTKANQFFDRYFEERVLRNPEWQSALGRKEQHNEWTSWTEEAAEVEYGYSQKMLNYLEDSILLSCLDDPTLLSARLLKDKLKGILSAYDYRYHNYPINSIDGAHLKIVSILVEEHAIADLRDAEAYISRVQKLDKKVEELSEQLE